MAGEVIEKSVIASALISLPRTCTDLRPKLSWPVHLAELYEGYWQSTDRFLLNQDTCPLLVHPSIYLAVRAFMPVSDDEILVDSLVLAGSPWALQFAIAAGATGIATSSSDEKLAIAKGLGAKHLINYRKDPDWGKETNGRGVDHIVEIGGQGTISKSINSVRMGGCIYLIGVLDQAEFPKDIFHRILARSAVVQGTLIGSISQFKDMIKLIEGNSEKTLPVIDKVFPFEDAVAAFAHLESQKHVGKIVIQVSTK
ncbi:hypothetical protein DFP72DRAFT_1139609 [Ephemerocybe angulata]|uniref:Alcohol dehydrogenase-like C-terminal domain-containing protein n=1 Tax=Ephemerocybe angulata TaxID=980116 RepID=A0A8H6HRA4_9AGAR|nr:hypothetical protein DFP72DRAFT_1139609 [Tulosesus angulatus]